MTAPAIRGWCPGALRPMQSGDGLVVRVRAAGGRLTPKQAKAIAHGARSHGNGLIDLSARANLQLRGVTWDSHAALIDLLREAALIDADPAAEARRNIVVTPFADAAADALAARLAEALARGPDLPGKFGFAVDTGPAPVLAATSADIRLERAPDGTLILRPDGATLGLAVGDAAAAAAAVALAEWFVAAGGVTGGRGRMAALIGRIAWTEGADEAAAAVVRRVQPELAGPPLPDAWLAPAPARPPPAPGLIPQGALVGCEFGQLDAETLAALADLGPLRLTPWRMLLVEGLAAMPALPALPGLILADDHRLRIHACTGAPGCVQALQSTRALARRLADELPPTATLHVSGCAKGCAHPGPAGLTLVATSAGYDLIRDGTAHDAPRLRGLDPFSFSLKDLD